MIRLVVIEKWENVESLKADAIAPHMDVYGENMRDQISSRMIHVLSPT